ncbi:hypothetical protein JTB14_031526 [Gonioctena quinquepunctata]|nr:hypothetical protein JTB14_031526 [Gonioctena quinquepunctata]
MEALAAVADATTGPVEAESTPGPSQRLQSHIQVQRITSSSGDEMDDSYDPYDSETCSNVEQDWRVRSTLTHIMRAKKTKAKGSPLQMIISCMKGRSGDWRNCKTKTWIL